MGIYDSYQQYNRLAPGEREFVTSHPFAARNFQRDANKALGEAASRYPSASLHNGEGDAFRHCYWNALMTRDETAALAEEFGNAHETEGGPLIESMMDLHNNRVGRRIGGTLPNGSDTELANACVRALDGDELVIIEGGVLVRSHSKVPFRP